MNRLLAIFIDTVGSQSWCDAVPMPRGQGSKLAGLHAPVAYAHDFGRESDDINLSGEGPG